MLTPSPARLMVMALLAMPGCAHHDDPIKFYRLDVAAHGTAAPAKLSPASIGLGPIRIPDYLDRPQIIVAITDQEYRLSEQHHWAEQLDQNIALALAKALPHLLGTEQIVRFPWPQRQALDYQISLDILEFHTDATGLSKLIAQWTIKRQDQILINKRSTFQAPASTSDYGLMVKSQSQCLSLLAQDIANTWRHIQSQTVCNGQTPGQSSQCH